MRRIMLSVTMLAVAIAGTLQAPTSAAKGSPRNRAFKPHVVVATLDTGTNPFHPAWRRDEKRHPSTYIPDYPKGAPALELRLGSDFLADVKLSEPALKGLLADKAFPYWVPGTNLVGLWAHDSDKRPIFDYPNAMNASATHSHGAAASSQIAGLDLGMATDVYLVVMDRTSNEGQDVYQTNGDALRWAADQPWIDIIHTNIQDIVPLSREENPAYTNYPKAVAYAVSKGKLVVSAGGNWYAEPTETSPHAGPSGVLAAGANDNCGYTDYSNPNPHVVMDGYGTVAAAANSYETRTFSGTSSASPRITGYAAQLLLQIRQHFGYSANVADGALVVLPKDQAPKEGPLSDGKLTAAELHEVIRKTADPNPHESIYDGGQGLPGCVPQPVAFPFSFYPKMGYGEVSEHTIEAAFDVAVGKAAMPSRPYEDEFYELSNELRSAFWE